MKGNKINEFLIISHLLATMLLTVGIRQFTFLTQYDIMNNLSGMGIHQTIRTVSPHEMMSLFESLFIATFLGLCLSLIISLVIIMRKKVSIMHSFIVFFIAFILSFIFFFNFKELLYVRNGVGHNYEGNLFALKYIVPGIICTSASLILFFSPMVNKFVLKNPLAKRTEVWDW